MRISYAPVAAAVAAALVVVPASAALSPVAKNAEQAVIVTEQWRGVVRTRVGIPVEIRLQAQAGTGFSWVVARAAAGLSEMRPLRGSRAMPGAIQTQRFRFVALRPGKYRLAFSYDQPWAGGTKGARTKAFTILVR